MTLYSKIYQPPLIVDVLAGVMEVVADMKVVLPIVLAVPCVVATAGLDIS
jgi:hypothetical protein